MLVRPIGSITPQRLPGTETARQPFWSADGRSIGYLDGGKLRKVAASGGPPQDICDVSGFQGGAWNSEGVIVYGSSAGLFRVSAEGGKPEAITSLEAGEAGHYWPHFLPDGRHYLYTAWTGDAAKRAVFAGALGSKEKTRVVAAESNAAYAAPGFLVFHRANAVYAQPFHPGKLALSGEPVRIADEVTYSPANGFGSFAVSPNGVLAYFQSAADTGTGTGPLSDTAEWQLAWIGRSGQVLETVGPSGVWRGFEVSPDNQRIAVHRHDAVGGDIWAIEPRGSLTRLTFDASRHNSMPVWSPDGARIVYSSFQNGKWGLYQNLSSGSGTEELLFESDLLKAPMSWSPDGKRIVFWVQDPKNSGDLWVLTMDGAKKAEPLVATPFNETHGQISPDGKWIAYTSNSSGRSEVYVQPFPSGSGRWQISNHGGDWPRWRRDGKELFFHSLGVADAPTAPAGPFVSPLLSAAVTVNGATLEPGSPKEAVIVPALNFPHSGGDYQTYAVSADGQRILMVQYANTSSTASGAVGPDAPAGLIVALNWASSIKK